MLAIHCITYVSVANSKSQAEVRVGCQPSTLDALLLTSNDDVCKEIWAKG